MNRRTLSGSRATHSILFEREGRNYSQDSLTAENHKGKNPKKKFLKELRGGRERRKEERKKLNTL